MSRQDGLKRGGESSLFPQTCAPSSLLINKDWTHQPIKGGTSFPVCLFFLKKEVFTDYVHERSGGFSCRAVRSLGRGWGCYIRLVLPDSAVKMTASQPSDINQGEARSLFILVCLTLKKANRRTRRLQLISSVYSSALRDRLRYGERHEKRNRTNKKMFNLFQKYKGVTIKMLCSCFKAR